VICFEALDEIIVANGEFPMRIHRR